MVMTSANLIIPPHQGLSGTELIFERENEFYFKNKSIWKRALSAYNGGREYIEQVLTKHPAETPEEFAERRDATYHLNLVKYSVRSFSDYIFSKEPRRIFPDGKLNPIVEDFDRQKQHANIVMRKMFDYYTLCNLTWAFVSMPNVSTASRVAYNLVGKSIRPHVVTLSPLAVPDWCFDDNGELEWIIIEEFVTMKADPSKAPEARKVRTLITKEYYQKFSAVMLTPYTYQPDTGITVSPKYKHGLGKVPVIPFSDIIYDKDFNKPAIEDVLTISEAIMKGESELLTNILKQTYGQVVLPMSSQAIQSRIMARISKELGGDYDRCSAQVERMVQQEVALVLSRNVAIFEDTDEVGIARYIQPDGATLSGIIDHNDRLINLTTRFVGLLTGVTTTQRSSADSKAMDNAQLSAQLNNISSKLQELESNIWKLFNSHSKAIKIPAIEYNKNFNLNDFKSTITGIVELANVNGGPAYRKQVKRMATMALDSISRIPDETYQTIRTEIENDVEAEKPPTFTEKPDHLSEASGSRPDSIVGKTDYQKGKASISKANSI